MQYMGGKSRIAKDIAAVINQYADGKPFYSLFCGSCAVETKIHASNIHINDAHPYLMAMWDDALAGRRYPTVMSEDEYRRVKADKDLDPALTGFVGFGCSFCGKFFGGLARGGGQNFADAASRTISRDAMLLWASETSCMSYQDVEIPDGSVVYCDPPYAKTTGYSTGDFNSDEFWRYVRELSKRCTVFVSEETAPDDFNVVWEKEVTRTLDRNKQNRPKKTEKLFVYRGGETLCY